MRRVRSYRIVSVGFGVSYNRIPVNNESGRQGQSPGIVAIGFGKINAEPQINFSQILRNGMNQAEFLSHCIAGVV